MLYQVLTWLQDVIVGALSGDEDLERGDEEEDADELREGDDGTG